MDKVYTLRVVVSLEDSDGLFTKDRGLQVRTQELTGDLTELCMMAPAVTHMAEGMTLAVLGAERRRHAEAALSGGDLPY